MVRAPDTTVRETKGAPAERENRRSRSRRRRAETEKKRPKSPELPKGGIRSHPSTSAKVKPAPQEAPSQEEQEAKAPDTSVPKQWPGRRYGTWTHDEASLGERPRCLHLFAGPQRKGDLADCLKKFGWATCSVDILQLHRTDLLDDQTRRAILEDIREGYFDAVFLGTPCETYSALRKERPGPRPLRSKEEITGLSSGLSPEEKKKLKEGNQHTEFSCQVMRACYDYGIPFTLENPEPIRDVSLWLMPNVREVANLRGVRHADFDQCMMGCETTKPTRLLYHLISHSNLNNLRCDHPKRTWTDSEGKSYEAPHERVKHRFKRTEDGRKEFASKALGNYHEIFCKELAMNIAEVKMPRAKKAAELLAMPAP